MSDDSTALGLVTEYSSTVAITAMWFTRIQQPIVIGTWYASQGIGIGLGGLIGYGIGQIDAAIAAWRYEFILIGLACALWGIAMAFIIPDSPYTSKRFTRDEKIVIMSRKRDDYHAVEKRQLKWDQVSYFPLSSGVCWLIRAVDQRIRFGRSNLPVFPLGSHRQYPKRRHVQLRYPYDQRFRIQHSEHDSSADPLRAQSDPVHVSSHARCALTPR